MMNGQKITTYHYGKPDAYANNVLPHANGKLPKLGYTRREAAQILAISTESLDRIVRRGLLRPSRALRRPLFTLAELERFLASTQV
jgi:hypothetical protein